MKNEEIKCPKSSCFGQINRRVTSTGTEVIGEKVCWDLEVCPASSWDCWCFTGEKQCLWRGLRWSFYCKWLILSWIPSWNWELIGSEISQGTVELEDGTGNSHLEQPRWASLGRRIIKLWNNWGSKNLSVPGLLNISSSRRWCLGNWIRTSVSL